MGPPPTVNIAVGHHLLPVMGDAPDHQCPMAESPMTMDIVDVATPDRLTVHITVPDLLTTLAAAVAAVAVAIVVALPHLTTETADVDGLLVPMGKIHLWVHVFFVCYYRPSLLLCSL